MSEELQNAPVEQSEKSSGSTEKKDSVKYESFQKALHEKKLAQEKYELAASKIKEYEEKLMEKEQDAAKKAEYWKEKFEETSKKLEETNQTYTWNMLTGQIESKAKELGCKDTKKLLRLMDDEDLKTLSKEIGEDFKLNNDVLDGILEKNKKENFFLFKEQVSKVADSVPKSKDFRKTKRDTSEILSEYVNKLK